MPGGQEGAQVDPDPQYDSSLSPDTHLQKEGENGNGIKNKGCKKGLRFLIATQVFTM